MHIERTQVEINSAKPKGNHKGAKEQRVHLQNKEPRVHP